MKMGRACEGGLTGQEAVPAIQARAEGAGLLSTQGRGDGKAWVHSSCTSEKNLEELLMDQT